MQRFETHLLTSFDATRLTWHEAGHGPALLLANGLGGTAEVWRHQVGYFSDRFRLLTWDYRGTHGSSAPTDRRAMRINDHLGDLLAVLDAARVNDVIVMGWSVGVQLAFELVRRAPDRVRAVVAIAGTAGRPWESAFGTRTFPRALALGMSSLRSATRLAGNAAHRVAQWPGATAWMKRLGLAASTLDDERFRMLTQAFATVDMELYLQTVADAGEHDARSVLPQVKVPTLVIVGERDPFTPVHVATSMAATVPDAELLVIPGGTHYVMLESPELINLRIDKFLRERGLRPPLRVSP